MASGETAEDGSFVFEDMPSGPFRVLAIDRVTGRQVSRSGSLVAGGSIESFDLFFSVEEFGTVRGIVFLASGDAASPAIVTVAGRQALTNAEGRFEIPLVPLGSHTVRAELPGVRRSTTVSVTLSAPGDVVDVSVTLPGAGQVVVTVLDSSGVPLAGQPVFRLQGGPCSGIEAFTDATGVAIFNEVPVPGAFFKSILGGDIATGSAKIRRDEDVDGVTLRFAGFGKVTGIVLDDQGEPALGAEVILGARRVNASFCKLINDARARLVQTGTDGRFAFEGIPVGSVTVSASTVFFPVRTSAKGTLLFDGELPRVHFEPDIHVRRGARRHHLLARRRHSRRFRSFGQRLFGVFPRRDGHHRYGKPLRVRRDLASRYLPFSMLRTR